MRISKSKVISAIVVVIVAIALSAFFTTSALPESTDYGFPFEWRQFGMSHFGRPDIDRRDYTKLASNIVINITALGLVVFGFSSIRKKPRSKN